MEAYKIENTQLLIEKTDLVYYIWDFRNDRDLILDVFKRNDQNLTYEKTICRSDPEYSVVAPPPDGNICKIVEEDYLTRETSMKINLKQLLTHPNKLLREIIKELLNENL